ncbi:hypothetical protein K438DRAFT_1623393 [Mycena galopus ATCC 62051]|nr:hypothetical protein K438DRAFT_1623393 [Mycena galopus ATCC 62051]
MLAVTLARNDTTAAQLVNGFWLVGIFLDVFGAVLATLSARWFELLDADEIAFLEAKWTGTADHSSSLRALSIENIVATALFSGLPIIASGVSLFLIDLLIYVWSSQPLLVAIISTIPSAMAIFVAACFLPQSGKKDHIVEILAKKRGAW